MLNNAQVRWIMEKEAAFRKKWAYTDLYDETIVDEEGHRKIDYIINDLEAIIVKSKRNEDVRKWVKAIIDEYEEKSKLIEASYEIMRKTREINGNAGKAS